MRRSDFIWSIIVLTTATTLTFANAYKWENKNNQVEYSQVPPENEEATVIPPPPPPPSSAAEESKNIKNIENKFKQADEAAAKQKIKDEKKAAIAHDKNYNCNLAKQHLADIQSKARIKLMDNGSSVLLSQEQRTEEIQKTEEAIKKYCNP